MGKTLLLVSHDLESIKRWCDEVIWLDGGVAKDRGDPRRVIDHYLTYLERGEEQELIDRERLTQASGAGDHRLTDAINQLSHLPSEPALERASDSHSNGLESNQPARWGSREIEIVKVSLYGANDLEKRVFHPEDSCTIEIEYSTNEDRPDPVFGIGIHRLDGVTVYGSNTHIEEISFPPHPPKGKVRFSMPRLGLLEGVFTVDVAVHTQDGYPYDYHRAAVSFTIRNPQGQIGVVLPVHSWDIEEINLERLR